jgi:hypothetical protein
MTAEFEALRFESRDFCMVCCRHGSSLSGWRARGYSRREIGAGQGGSVYSEPKKTADGLFSVRLRSKGKGSRSSSINLRHFDDSR